MSIKHRAGAISVLATLSGAASAASITTFQGSFKALQPWLGYANINRITCSETRTIYGAEPADGLTHPVLIWAHSTGQDLNIAGPDAEGENFIAQAAAQGYVAISPTYDSIPTISNPATLAQARCMMDSTYNKQSAVAYACSLPEANCAQGIYTMGFSQGGAIALEAGNYTPVRAAFAMGVNDTANYPPLAPPPTGTRVLPNNDVLIEDGAEDVQSTGVSGLELPTGDTCTGTDCLQPDGSGWYACS